jgi:molecular chaperone DnaK
LFKYNKLLGEFNLEGIAPAMRGLPQIEVTLDIDANGILNVSAKDKNTGKENKITIKSDSGLSKEDIERMIKEAEANAEDDKKAAELITARNQAEGTAHSIKKDYDTYKDQLTEEERTAFDTAVTALEDACKGDDTEAIKESVQKFYEAAGPVMAKKQAAESTTNDTSATQPAGEQTVDASFTEVDDSKKE